MESIEKRNKRTVDINEMITIVGEYGPFQKIVNLMFCISMFPTLPPLMIMYFCIDSPPWRCVANSTNCVMYNTTFDSKDDFRCTLQRHEWEYTTSRDHSIVTEFDLVCKNQYLTNLPTSLLFFGFMCGASVLGSVADNFGRKITHYVSLVIVILFGFISTFSGNIYVFLAFRFIIGFFLHGTFPQVYIMISEIVGNDDRAWANNITFIFGTFAFLVLALKAYLVSSWKLLFRLFTIPYLFVLLFYLFVPESVRYLRIKGRTTEAMAVFKRMAYWNKTELPTNITLMPVPTNTKHKTTPLDLVRTKKIALVSLCLGWYCFAGATTFYCLYLAASDITGHIYTDFVVITVIDIPMILVGTVLINKYGRKKNALVFTLIGSFSCIALGLTPKYEKLKMLRLVFGMVGKTSIVACGMAVSIWVMELFPTDVRGEGVGMTQVTNKLGATSSAWINSELSKVSDGAPFIFIGVLSLTSFFLLAMLHETKGINISDTIGEAALTDSTSESPMKSVVHANQISEDLENNIVAYSNIVDDDTETNA